MPSPARAVACSLLLLILGLAGCKDDSASQPQNETGAQAAEPVASRPAPPEPAARVLAPQIVPAEVNAPRRRIISCAPNITEICCGVGLQDWLVGRTSYCRFPPSVEKVRSIGALTDLNVEVVRALQPDLVLVAGESRGISERLAPLGLQFESMPDDSIDDLFASIRRIGMLTQREATAQELAKGVIWDLESVTRRYAGCKGKRVLIVTGTMADPPAPPYVAGPGSFYNDLLTAAGHENAARGTQMPFAPLALEQIMRSDPDVIIELDPEGDRRPGGDAEALAAWKPIGDLSAVRNGNVRVLKGPEHYILGPRIGLTFEALCAAICGPAD